MAKIRSWKFWIIFWSLAVIFLASWWFFCQIKNREISRVAEILPINQETKTLAYFFDYFFQKDDQVRTFLVLFQNNLEIRPGGGFLGSFGVVKIKNGQLEKIEVHDLSNFDARVPKGIEPFYPMKETLHITSLKMKDSNFSPDFATNAKKAEEFYYLGQGQEKFDGVIGIDANVLTSFLKATGPVAIPDYPGTYGDENAILTLEYQVEKAYVDQGITVENRKSIMSDLAQAILGKVSSMTLMEKWELAKIIQEDLNKKDIQLYFHNEALETSAVQSNWGGKVDETWANDYLMTVDANLGAYKSDYFIKRSLEYNLDLTKENPQALVSVKYEHTAEKRDWMTKEYVDYLRLYVPNGAWLDKVDNASSEAVFGNDLGKKYFGVMVRVPLGEEKTIVFHYSLPKNFKADDYILKIQKQAGLNDVPVTIEIKKADGSILKKKIVLNKDEVLK